MLSLSQTTGYAIQALGCMNGLPDPARQIAIVAKCSGVPRPYLAKIIAALSQKGLISTKRGCRGGLSLTRPPEQISLLEIVEAVEGEHWMGECLLGFENCVHHLGCPTTAFWRRTRREIAEMLRTTSLAEVLTAKQNPSPRAARGGRGVRRSAAQRAAAPKGR